jgi:DNA-binding FrmR family transcriptional regulator
MFFSPCGRVLSADRRVDAIEVRCASFTQILALPDNHGTRGRGRGRGRLRLKSVPPIVFVLGGFDNTIPGYIIYRFVMAHVIQNKKKLLARISRIRGQINGIEKALNEERECGEVLLTLAACRGAMNALMAEILEGHVRLHLLQSDSQKDAAVAAAGEELIEVIKRYLK